MIIYQHCANTVSPCANHAPYEGRLLKGSANTVILRQHCANHSPYEGCSNLFSQKRSKDSTDLELLMTKIDTAIIKQVKPEGKVQTSLYLSFQFF